jgi:hypothetical protein
MTELEPYEPARIDLRNPHTDGWTDILEAVADLAHKIAGTDFVPTEFRGNVAATAATILYGREVGFGPMQALGTLHSIKGRVAMSSEAMRAKALAAGHDIVIAESTTAKCVAKGRRKGTDEWTTVTWTIDNARQAKLGGDNWTKYPRQMLQARATAELCRLVFADVIHGLAAVEELEQDGTAVLAIAAGEPPTRVQRRRPAQPEPPLEAPVSPPAPTPVETAEPDLQDAETPTQTSDADSPRPPDQGPGPDAEDPGPAPTNAALNAQVLALCHKHGGNFADLVSPLVGRKITRTSQLTAAEAQFVIGELTAQLDQADNADGPMFDELEDS